MNAQHTPGPWKFGVHGYPSVEKPFDYQGENYTNCPSIYSENGDEVVGCDEYLVFKSPADARLLTAAPELLEALQQISDYARQDGDIIAQHLAGIARAAIAKATGSTA